LVIKGIRLGCLRRRQDGGGQHSQPLARGGATGVVANQKPQLGRRIYYIPRQNVKSEPDQSPSRD